VDPEETLEELRNMSAEIMKNADSVHPPTHNWLAGAAVELAEKFQAMDEWISKGGFLPKAWTRP
jgi:hypothetical protein